MQRFVNQGAPTLSVADADLLAATEFKSVEQFKEMFSSLCLIWPSWVDTWHQTYQSDNIEDILCEIADEIGILLPKGYDNCGSKFDKLDWVGNDEYTQWWFIRPRDEDWTEIQGRRRNIIDLPCVIETDDAYDWELNSDRMPCRVWRIDPSAETITMTQDQLKFILEM